MFSLRKNRTGELSPVEIKKLRETNPMKVYEYFKTRLQAEGISFDAKPDPNDLLGDYTYHGLNGKTPFRIIGFYPWRGDYTFEVEIIEFDGKRRRKIKTDYTAESIQNLLLSGNLIRRGAQR